MTRKSIFDITPAASKRVKDPVARLRMQKRELERRYYEQRKDFVLDPEAEAWYVSQFSRIEHEIARVKALRKEADQFGYRGEG